MKILLISGSPRKGKTSHFMLSEIDKHITKNYPSIKTEIIELAGKKIAGCNACGHCRKGVDCSIKDDFIDLIPKLNDKELGAIIVATPVYMGSMTSQCKAFFDRTVLFRRNGFLLKNKIGAVVSVGGSRNGGQEITIQGVHAAMLIHDMIIVGDGGSTSHFGGIMHSGGGVENDNIGLKTVLNTAERVAALVSAL